MEVISIIHAIFFPGIIIFNFSHFNLIFVVGVLGTRSLDGFLGLGACCAGSSGFFGFGALYINIDI